MFKLDRRSDNNSTTIAIMDDAAGDGGGYRNYVVIRKDDEALHGFVLARVAFQSGPIPENGVNGTTIEDLLQICQHRLQCFQADKFPCEENAVALQGIEIALTALMRRTEDRKQRTVEGKLEK